MNGSFKHSLETTALLVFAIVSMQGADSSEIGRQQHKVKPEPKLMNAIWYRDLKQMKLLLKRGANPNVRANDGSPAIVGATLFRAEAVELLIKYGARVNVRGKGGQTALIVAGAKAEPETVQLLLDHGAKIGMKDDRGSTALSLCIEKNAYPSGDSRWTDPRIKKTRLILLRASGLIPDLQPKTNRAFGNSVSHPQVHAVALACDRYKFLRRIENKMGVLLLWQQESVFCTAMFPVGKSDRMYLVILSAYWFAGSSNGSNIPSAKPQYLLLCYQHNHGEDRLVYRIELSPSHKPSEGNRPSGDSNILEKLRYNGFAVRGDISKVAKAELSANRNYAQYTYIPYTNSLVAWLSNNSTDGVKYGDDFDQLELGKDLITAKNIENREFYRKYGLFTTVNERVLIKPIRSKNK